MWSLSSSFETMTPWGCVKMRSLRMTVALMNNVGAVDVDVDDDDVDVALCTLL